ncbi:hypothetical protein MCRY_16490 [Marivita cryptomonadis]|nr:hypothetical protein MCRY_16490 [Marivita cryptomonadis]
MVAITLKVGAGDGDLARQTGEFSSLEAWLAFMQDYFDRPGGFAFETSLHGIRLRYDLKGVPTVLSDVSSTDPHLYQRMAEWRTIAQRLVEGPPVITIVLPSEYVLFRTIDGDVVSQADQDWWTEQIVREKQLTRADVSLACQSQYSTRLGRSFHGDLATYSMNTWPPLSRGA